MLSLHVCAANAAESWIADSKGCKVYNPNPLRGESITWDGPCAGGYAEGEGTLTWFRGGRANSSYVGEMHGGKMDGKGRANYASGDRYEGEFYLGRYDGSGIYTFANGNRYEGDFVAGSSTRGGTLTLTDKRQFKTDLVTGVKWPSEFLAPAALLVLCFDSASVLRTMDLVRSSGFPLEDERAFDIVRIREAHRENVMIGATSSEELVSDPIPGCHMVGVSYEHNDYVFFRRY